MNAFYLILNHFGKNHLGILSSPLQKW